MYAEADDQHKKSYIINESGFKQPDDFKDPKKTYNGRNNSLHLEMQFEKIPDFTAGSKLFLSGRLIQILEQCFAKK